MLNGLTEIQCLECGDIFTHQDGPWEKPTRCASCEMDAEQAADDRRDQANEDAKTRMDVP